MRTPKLKTTPLKFIHVNQHVDRDNKRDGTNNPCITVKQGKDNRYAAEVEVLDAAGQVALRVCYRPDEPLPNNARCWIEAVAACRLLRRGQVVAMLPVADPNLRCSVEYRVDSGRYAVRCQRGGQNWDEVSYDTPNLARDAARAIEGRAIIHVSKKAIKANLKAATDDAILAVWQGVGALEADKVEVLGPSGEVLATVTYRPHDPLPCGARCWVETTCELQLIGEVASPGKRDRP